MRNLNYSNNKCKCGISLAWSNETAKVEYCPGCGNIYREGKLDVGDLPSAEEISRRVKNYVPGSDAGMKMSEGIHHPMERDTNPFQSGALTSKEVIINMTPHTINLCDGDNNIVRSIESSGTIRLSAMTEPYMVIDGITITKTVFGQPQGLPEYKEGVYYVVSQLVKSALPNRPDLLVPAEVVRNSDGVIIGAKSLGL